MKTFVIVILLAMTTVLCGCASNRPGVGGMTPGDVILEIANEVILQQAID